MRDYVIEQLGESDGMLILGDAGFDGLRYRKSGVCSPNSSCVSPTPASTCWLGHAFAADDNTKPASAITNATTIH
jgi:hypothetical protein